MKKDSHRTFRDAEFPHLRLDQMTRMGIAMKAISNLRANHPDLPTLTKIGRLEARWVADLATNQLFYSARSKGGHGVVLTAPLDQDGGDQWSSIMEILTASLFLSLTLPETAPQLTVE